MMGRTKKQAEPDEASGAPEWMVTFSDCMTLLLTFFVLLLSFSSFDIKIFRELKVIFSKNLPSTSPQGQRDKDAFLPTRQIQQGIAGPYEGSEKPTLSRGSEDNRKEDTEPVDFHSRKVFLIPSEKIFWGKGTAISIGGRDIMASMASFLKEVPSRVVISESRPGEGEADRQFGLLRAWAVLEYLTTKQGLDKKWFSISATSTLAQESFESDEPARARTGVPAGPERSLEIVLLERSIYN
jgi:chemotaxis protein MotB